MAARTRSLDFGPLVDRVWAIRLGGDQHGRQHASSKGSAVASGEVDSIVLIRTIVRLRRFSSIPSLAARSAIEGSYPSSRRSCLARGFELASLATDAARPGVLAKRVNHRAADAALGKRLELDAARLVEAVRRVDETEDAILNEIAEVDRVRHRGRHSPGERLYERKPCDDPVVGRGSYGLE